MWGIGFLIKARTCPQNIEKFVTLSLTRSIYKNTIARIDFGLLP